MVGFPTETYCVISEETKLRPTSSHAKYFFPNSKWEQIDLRKERPCKLLYYKQRWNF